MQSPWSLEMMNKLSRGENMETRRKGNTEWETMQSIIFFYCKSVESV